MQGVAPVSAKIFSTTIYILDDIALKVNILGVKVYHSVCFCVVFNIVYNVFISSYIVPM